ncbi:MAG: hypothetical protein ABI165_00650, partial [Bryobacteraceae bacterium]
STMAAIVDDPAPPIGELNPSVPAPLRWCVERCLAKDRDDRYASTADLERELKTIRAHVDDSSQSQPALAARPHRRRATTWPLWLALASFLAGWLATELLLLPRSTIDLSLYKIRPLANTAVYQGSPAWSADGKSIAYVGQVEGVRQVFVRDLASPMAAQITRSATDCSAPFWSPDDSRIFYLGALPGRSRRSLWSAGATGGAPELVEENTSAAALSPDGKTLTLLRADPSGKQPLSMWLATPGQPALRQVTTGPLAAGNYRHGFVAFSPNGASIGLWLTRWDGNSEFWILPFPAGSPRLAFAPGHTAYPFSWMPDNRHIVFGGQVPGSLGADLEIMDTKDGGVRPLSMTTRDAVSASVSPDGKRIAFTASQDDFDLIDVPLDGAAPHALLATSQNETDPAWSPDGTELAHVTDRTGSSQIWLRSPRDGWERPLVTEKEFGRRWIAAFGEPRFSPDGQRIAYSAAADASHSIYISNVAGGKPVRLAAENSDQRSPSWSPDGAWIAYLRNVNGKWSLVKARSGGGGQPIVLREHCLPSHPKWQTKSGPWIAIETAAGLTLVSDDGAQTRVLDPDHWLVFGWSGDDKRLYGIKNIDGRRRAIVSIDIETKAAKVLGDLTLPAAAEVRGFSLSPDGKSFATSASHPTGDIWVLSGFRWPGLRRWFTTPD